MLTRALVLLLVAACATIAGVFEKSGEFTIFRAMTSVFYPQHGWHTFGDDRDVLFTMAKLRQRSSPRENVLLEFNDDPERYFSNVPAEPIDYAVVLQNVSQSKPKAVMIGANLTWEKTNEYAVTALDAAAAKIPQMIFSAVVHRSPQGEEMPSSMMKSSLPLVQLRGDASTLPVVNRLAFANAYCGTGEAWCGFSLLEGIKPQGEGFPLMARWGERVIFSSTFLFFLAEMNQALADLEIEIGKSIRCSVDGTMILIDEFGQMKITGKRGKTNTTIMAHEFIDKNKSLDQFGSAKVESVMMMDYCQRQSDEIFQAQARMAMGIEAMRETKVLGGRMNFRRVPEHLAWLFTGSFALIMAACGKRSQRCVAALVTSGLWILGICIFGFWVPYLPLLSAAMVSVFLPTSDAR